MYRIEHAGGYYGSFETREEAETLLLSWGWKKSGDLFIFGDNKLAVILYTLEIRDINQLPRK